MWLAVIFHLSTSPPSTKKTSRTYRLWLGPCYSLDLETFFKEHLLAWSFGTAWKILVDHVVQTGWNQQVGDALKVLHQSCLGSLTHFISKTSIFDYFFQRRLNNVKDNKLFSQTNVFPESWIATYWSTTMSRLDHVLCSSNFEWLGVLYLFGLKTHLSAMNFSNIKTPAQRVYICVCLCVYIYIHILEVAKTLDHSG